MLKFLQRFSTRVIGVLNGLDRIRFRGTKRLLASVGGMIHYFRLRKLLHKDFTPFAAAMTEVFVQEAMEKVESLAKTALSALERGDGLQMQLSVLKKLMRAPLADTIALKREIAARVIRSEHYVV